jgi:signal transduction histidine kinase
VTLGLRWKILLLTALPVAALTLASLWLLERGVAGRTTEALQGDLTRAADVLENMLAARTSQLEATGAVIVRDPRFFSVLTLPHGRNDAQFRATVAGVAGDFEALEHPDVFEVTDARGEVVASVGAIDLDPEARDRLRSDGTAGRGAHYTVVVRGTHVILVTTPIVADQRVVGALVLGTQVGEALAADLRHMTKSDVTFLSQGRVTRSTLERAGDRDVALRAAARPGEPHRIDGAGGRWFALARALPYAPDARGESFVLQRSFDAETVFLRDVRSRLVEVGLLALLALVLTSAFVAMRITQPVRQLVSAAEAMEGGRWDEPIDDHGRDELGVLAARFRQMRQRQKVYVENLEEVARAKSEFIAVASHELRTPIAIIKGWRDLLAMGVLGPDHPRYSQGLDAIESACGTLERIAVDATRMADNEQAAEHLDRTWTDLRPVLEAAIADALDAGHDRKVEVRLRIEAGSARACIDAPVLQRGLDALVRNAIRFTPDGGLVDVVARGVEEFLEVSVRDNGIGLSPALRTRLLERTYAPEDAGHHHTGRGLEFNRPGLGFGLTLARRVAEVHGGELCIEGEEGRGSTFTLILAGALSPVEEREAA